MKAFLLYKDQDFDLEQLLPSNEAELTQDLDLETLFTAMVDDDDFLYDVVSKVVLSSAIDINTIIYRQDIIKDCLKNPSIVRELYQITVDSVENKKRGWMGIFSTNPSSVLYDAVELVQMFVGLLNKIKNIANEHANQFKSEGFTTFFKMIKNELNDEYFTSVQNHLNELKFRRGVLISAELGKGNEGTNYILRKPNDKDPNWIKRILALKNPEYSFYIHPRDEHGSRALYELKERGINLVANALGQSADHIESFFNMLRIELAFYVGCLNLFEQLSLIGETVSFPLPVTAKERRHSFHGLYDVCLALTKKQKIVGNEVDADNKNLIIITGANQGGKSTFLRSIGLAQMMMQCGMFVPAASFCANLCEGIFTHYKRKEDATMESGKLDEELSRMSTIVDNITPNCLILFNESFSATNEREGSEIARQITSALLEKHIKVFFVTHQYDFAHGFYSKKLKNAIFLRAQRKGGGGRTYKIVEGEPLQTSYGEDIYHTVFGNEIKYF